MFNFDDKDLIIKLIKSKRKDAYVSPLYVRNYNERYALNELSQIRNFNPSSFRVGFGVIVSIFDKCSFPSHMMYLFEPVYAFSNFDEDKNINERFIIFEIGKEVTYTDEKDDHVSKQRQTIENQIQYYQDMLFDHLVEQQKEYRKQLIQSMIDENSK